jgi:hypothetical protein
MGGCNSSNNDSKIGGNPSSTPTPKSTPTKPKSWIVESNFFTFELHQCRRSGTSVICDFTVTNNDKDRYLGISGQSDSTFLYDEYNNASRGGGAEIANVAKTTWWAGIRLINGVPTSARVYFENFAPTSNKITRMDILMHPEDSDFFTVQYRNIPIGNAGQ